MSAAAPMYDCVVVGAGASGLAAAHRLAAAEPRPSVLVLEAEERFGGKVRSELFAGRPLDFGAEAMISRVPGIPELFAELGLRDSVVTPASDRAYVWTRNLHPLPAGMLAGLPGGAGELVASRILTPAGLARASFDLIAPARALEGDESIGALVRRRLGGEVLARLIDPLLGGIHAGDCDELSVRATAPMLVAAMETGRGLVRGLRATAPPRSGGSPFASFAGGLATLTDALRAAADGVELRTGAAVQLLRSDADGSLRLALTGGPSVTARTVVLAVPAPAAAGILSAASPPLARELGAIRYASVATVALAYPAATLASLPPGSGLLAQRRRGHTITACTFSSAKWAHLAGDPAIVKCSVGWSGDRSALALDDEALVDAVRADLERVAGVRGAPLEARVERFDDALPQYEVGHLERIAAIDAGLRSLSGVSVCGAAYRGAGVGACIRDGRAAAARALAALAGDSGSAPAHASS